MGIALPAWYTQLASFDKDLVVSDLSGDNKLDIVDEISIRTLSFEDLFKQKRVSNVDVLHIDTEGADWLILSGFLSTKFTPDIIIFEHNHITLASYKEAVTALKKRGYNLLKIGTDTFCYRKNLSGLYAGIRTESSRIVK